jgi:hypothetical protein
MIWPRRTMSWADSWPYPNISSCHLDDCINDLDELLRITEPVILVDVPGLEFL